MNREAPVAYDYEAKGAADFKANRKDERLYANAENHGASYRRGWQNARRQADAGQDTRPAPFHVEPKGIAREPKPEDWNGSPGSVSIVQPVEVTFGPERTPLPDGVKVESVRISLPVTREQVRLQTGEDKPKKPKPADPEQLAFF